MKIQHISILALAAVALCGCGNSDKVTEAPVREELVETTVISKSEITRKLDLSTNLEGYQTLNVAPSVTGRIEHIYVEVGSAVKAGDLLVRMDQTQFNNIKLQYANLKVDLARMEALDKIGAVSRQTYDQIKLSYDQVEEQYAFLEKNTFVKADFGGVISAKNYEDGELYSGQPILVLNQINTLKAYINIPESYFTKIKSGMKAEIVSDIYPGETFPATIEIIYPTVDVSSHTFQVKLRIPNSNLRLRPGMYVHTNLEMGYEKALVVPYSAVQKMIGSNDRFVYINDNGVAKRIFVKLGQRFDEDIEILSDEIQEGDKLVTTGQARIVDGSKLKVVKEN